MATGFSMVDQVRYWSYKILPLVYDESLSYMETQAKVIAALNTLIENNNKIPDFIKEQFAAFIESDEMRTMIATLVTSLILNVKFPPEGIKPARGNGVTDDTEAIQGCIDFASANGGGAVYIPYGTYFTRPLTMKENVTVYGDSANATRLLLKSGANAPMITAHCDNVRFYDICIDGNILNQINRVNVIDFIGNSFTLTDSIVTGGKNCAYLKSSENGIITITNVEFGYAIENHLVLYGGNGTDEENYVTAFITVRDCTFKELSETQPAALKHCIINSYRFARFLNMGLFAVAPHSAIANAADFCTYTGIAPNAATPITGNSNCNVSFDKGLTMIDAPDEYKIFSRGQLNLFSVHDIQMIGQSVKIAASSDITLQTTGNGRVKYKTPANLSEFFDFIEFKGENDAVYKILVSNAGTQNVGKGSGTGGGIDLPEGGTIGQVLVLGQNGLEWLTIPDALPTDGSLGQVLTQGETGAIWQDIPTELPINGTAGQYLKLTAEGLKWANLPDPPTELPTGGVSGNFLKVGTSGLEWANIKQIPDGGTTGQGLSKTANGYGWLDFAGLSGGKVIATQITARVKTISTNYAMTADDVGYRIRVNSTTDITITFNADAFPVNGEVEFVQVNTGKFTLAGGSGVGLHSSNGAFTSIQIYSRAGAFCDSTNEIIVGGDLA